MKKKVKNKRRATADNSPRNRKQFKKNGAFRGSWPDPQIGSGGGHILPNLIRSSQDIVRNIADHRDESGLKFFKYHGSGRVGPGHPDPRVVTPPMKTPDTKAKTDKRSS